MTDQLTEDDIVTEWDNEDELTEYGIKIETETPERAEELKQQILSNQKVVERLREINVVNILRDYITMRQTTSSYDFSELIDFTQELQSILDGKEK